MILLTMRIYLSLLWGISVLFSVETECAAIPDTSSISATLEPNNATTQVYTSHVLHNETETQTHKPADMSSGAMAVTALLFITEAQEANVSSSTQVSNVNTTGTVVASVAAATASSSHHVLTSVSQATPSRDAVSSETAKPTEDQQSPTVSGRTTTTATFAVTTLTPSAASLLTAAMSSSHQPTSATEPEVSPQLSSTTSSDYLTQVPLFSQSIRTATMTTDTNQTSEAAPVFDPTSFPATKSEAATTTVSIELSPTSRPISDTQTHMSTSKLPGTAGSSSTTDSPTSSQHISDSAVSSPAGVRPVPKKSQVSTTKSDSISTASPHEASQSPTTTKDQSCSTRGVVMQCLIIIASLAGLATIFMVSTIVLCAKLSVRKYRRKKPQRSTEMICISSLLPERNYTYTRQRNPVSNGVLVIPTGGDSDEDNLTLSSFLPENERTL